MNKNILIFLMLLMIHAASFCIQGSYAQAAEKPLNVRISVAGGYDDNAALTSARKADGFAQESASLIYQRLIDRKAQLRLYYTALNVNYFEVTDQNFLLNQVTGGLSFLITPSTIWENDYTFQYLDFLRNVPVTSYSNEIRTGLKQKFGDRLNFRGGFSFSDRQYDDKKVRFGNGALSTDEERNDLRYTIDDQFNYKLNSAVILILGNQVLWNESNDLYFDYYDYLAYRFFGGFSWRIAKSWSSSFRLTYERREYENRLRSGSDTATESDDIYTATASLYYKINPQLSAGSTYTYRQKNSNEPSQEYSGASGTLGLYYSF